MRIMPRAPRHTEAFAAAQATIPGHMNVATLAIRFDYHFLRHLIFLRLPATPFSHTHTLFRSLSLLFSRFFASCAAIIATDF